MHTTTKRALDAASLLYEWGLEAQAVAMTMWKHEIAQPLGICQACGRLAARDLPRFGPRCLIAVEQWDRAAAAIRRLLTPPLDNGGNRGRVVGRVHVPTKGA